MATINSLAIETLSTIFEQLELDRPRGPPPIVDTFHRDVYNPFASPLFAASIVSRRWKDPAKRLLNLDAFFPCEEAWLASQSRTKFHVRSIALDEPVEQVERMLEACPGLERLYLLG